MGGGGGSGLIEVPYLAQLARLGGEDHGAAVGGVVQVISQGAVLVLGEDDRAGGNDAIQLHFWGGVAGQGAQAAGFGQVGGDHLGFEFDRGFRVGAGVGERQVDHDHVTFNA